MKKNIIYVVGLSGCGKTTLSEMLAEHKVKKE